MKRALRFSTAQGGGIRFSNLAGTREGRSMLGPTDSVFVTWALTVTPDGKGWMLKRAKGDPLSKAFHSGLGPVTM
jgi:hypothetical protein